jgi:ABC-type polysaccharide/polyol phosphate transport system ATPase subunit
MSGAANEPQSGAAGPAPDDDWMLRLVDVSHSYHARRANFERGEHRVLDGVSFAVRRGETLGIIGRNGAGKTTLLRLMAGILAPRRGRVLRRPGVHCSLLSLGLGFSAAPDGARQRAPVGVAAGCLAHGGGGLPGRGA